MRWYNTPIFLIILIGTYIDVLFFICIVYPRIRFFGESAVFIWRWCVLSETTYCNGSGGCISYFHRRRIQCWNIVISLLVTVLKFLQILCSRKCISFWFYLFFVSCAGKHHYCSYADLKFVTYYIYYSMCCNGTTLTDDMYGMVQMCPFFYNLCTLHGIDQDPSAYQAQKAVYFDFLACLPIQQSNLSV